MNQKMHCTHTLNLLLAYPSFQLSAFFFPIFKCLTLLTTKRYTHTIEHHILIFHIDQIAISPELIFSKKISYFSWTFEGALFQRIFFRNPSILCKKHGLRDELNFWVEELFAGYNNSQNVESPPTKNRHLFILVLLKGRWDFFGIEKWNKSENVACIW